MLVEHHVFLMRTFLTLDRVASARCRNLKIFTRNQTTTKIQEGVALLKRVNINWMLGNRLTLKIIQIRIDYWRALKSHS